ncbi:hypothetical protein GQF61_10605 [Sphingobacterium sp. DK4209]|uniref:Uncharacterized protein n=1 Tax=Sphingobacterium zhuxiongii TaxID=2662364 RepID=A0A5Q0QD19_9SPHI|nr:MULTISPECIES: hypothetical protein [unclassified Sphingobacterium]MVZ66309.1 hypothetical protein [Sphingobacterium sp. DK4209]QGA25090.1 hypothetical protein GFH32_01575 [Sphingobacterium sp. dk4302]
MLTFADFFAKKKIDIKALKKAEPALYQEFAAHYELMGEKSFDHSKKFWFNRLRKNFLLEEAIVETSPKKPIQESESNSIKVEGTTSKPAGFRPKIKIALNNPTNEANAIVENEVSGETETKPAVQPKDNPQTAQGIDPITEKQVENPNEKAKKAAPSGFKPRFKASNLPKKIENENLDDTPSNSEESTNTNEEKTAAAKPAGFKPRFKAANLPKKIEETAEGSSDSVQEKPANTVDKPTVTTKPAGFRPRFNAANLPKKVEETAIEETPKNTSTNTEQEETTASKPQGFKPRFKAGVTKTSNSTDPKPESKEQKAEESTEADDTKSEETSVINPAKPKGFTPRFKVKKITDEGNDSPSDEAR